MDIRSTFSVKRTCSACERYRGADCEFCDGMGERIVECYAHELTDEELHQFYSNGSYLEAIVACEELALRAEEAA